MGRLRSIQIFDNQKGQVSVLSYVVLVFLTIIISAFLAKAVNESNLVQRQRLLQEVTYLAEGGIDDAIFSFSQAIANFDVPANIAIWPEQPDPVPDPPVQHITTYSSFNSAQVQSVIFRLDDVDRVTQIEGGATALIRNYEVVASAEHPLNNTVAVTLHQIVARRIIPAFQHAVFYEEDLEILPGPAMSFAGRIHCNQDIYLGAESSLTLDSFYVRSAGSIYNRRKNDGSETPGEVSIRITKPEGEPAEYALMDGLDSESENWTTESQVRWQGSVQNSVHGVTRMAAPQVRSIQPDGYYAEQAGLNGIKILNDSIARAGTELVEGVDIPMGTITTSTSFYNNREEKNMLMTDLDMKKLAGFATEEEYLNGTPSFPNNLPDNGLIYATRNNAGDIYQPGIRLKDGEEISRSAGLTVVTNDPLYIEGNYNTESKKPCALISDSLNILSSGWDNDVQSTQSVDQRLAEETTVNAAFIAGVDQTDPEIDRYNGGLENYPRLHEKWSGKNLNILGAFLSLWNSQIAEGAWIYGQPQYTAPRRNWNYDLDFNDTGNLPPFTPWAVEMKKVAWWR